ncbi:MAG: 3-phosphoshikimate 1-carboxyvinyltransferase [Firmicutes bacterium]|nr:3-phosphoshikimate 1-carboxyvinyltransferase [Bacillota bacterium]
MKPMNDILITKAPDGGTVDAIASKSAAHRILIAGFLSGLDLDGVCDELSDDITATKICLQRLCTALRQSGSAGDRIVADCVLPCGESGSTLRFLLPLAGALGIESDFVCQGRLPDRPMEPLLECLAEHGCKVEGRNPKHLSGRLTGGTFRLPGDVSSQYVTGLLMALPLVKEDSEIVVEGRLQSRPYVDLTLQVLREAGIRIDERESLTETKTETIFSVSGGQAYHLPAAALEQIEGDWSNAAFWIVMDAMLRLREAGGHIVCQGLDPASAQGDKAVVTIAEQMLAAGTAEIDIDAADVPDLVPALAVLSCGRPAGSITNIINAGRLRFKESDRLHAAAEVLSGLGADITETETSLTTRSKGRLTGGTADSFGDHRIVMMAAAAACIAAEPITIKGATAVNKSYPRFFEDYQKLGGKLQWL